MIEQTKEKYEQSTAQGISWSLQRRIKLKFIFIAIHSRRLSPKTKISNKYLKFINKQEIVFR